MLSILISLLACHPPTNDTGRGEHSTESAIDLATPLGPTEARAGLVTDPAALFGGISAEGRAGDYKIYNDRVQFIIQGPRVGDFIVQQSGNVVDADVVRPAEVTGRDFVDEWAVTVAPTHLMDLETITVVDDGIESGRAVIRVEGPDSPLEYITGAMENDAVVPDLGLWFETEYALDAGSWMMDVTTTITALTQDVSVDVGDVIFGSREAASGWMQGKGLSESAPDTYQWGGYLGRRNEGATVVMADPNAGFVRNLTMDVLTGLLAVAPAYPPATQLAQGESVTVHRLYAVGPDLATLTDEWLDRAGSDWDDIEGQVDAPDGPVPGARVHVLIDGLPWSVAYTDEDGRFSCRVPAGAELSVRATARGPGFFSSLPEGAAPWSPYTTATIQDAVLSSLSEGEPAPALAQARGVATEDDPLYLQEPGWITLRAADGLPFEARLDLDGGGSAGPGGLAQDRPEGHTTLGWARQGTLTLPVEPGEYTLLAHRGVRYELSEQRVQVLAGEETTVDLTLPVAFQTDGWLEADPHSHAAPSPDGRITMADRLVVHAATGVQLHFGTDHDHIVDYGPLAQALGLDPVMRHITACEISPLLRGHVNAYPLEAHPEQPNGGAFLWWQTDNRVQSTQEEFDLMEQIMPGSIRQVNHPLDGMAALAGWSPGTIAKSDFWTDDFDAIEVINGGSHSGTDELYLDLINRGLLVAPVGVSDSHAHLSSGPGINITWLGVGVDDPQEVTSSVLIDAMRARRTVASTGPFIALDPAPGSEIQGSLTLSAQALSPSWIQVDRLKLVENGLVIDIVEGTEASWLLTPAQDATYIVVAEGDQGMSPVSSSLPWAMTSAILVDVDGDGWTAPLPSLVME